MSEYRKKNGMTAVFLFAVSGGMVGMAFASAPLYRLFCQVTGFGGTPKTDIMAKPTALSDRFIAVRFDANIHSSLPWRFQPAQRQIKVRLGETALAHYTAKNLSDTPLVGTATFNVTPFKTAEFFSKVDCFCFTEQRLMPGEEVSMSVSFFVDPELLDDPSAKEVRTITLSYTFFQAEKDKAAEKKPITKGGGISSAAEQRRRPVRDSG
jgi:cytochrome c oxidase assembly protein subunit 11